MKVSTAIQSLDVRQFCKFSLVGLSNSLISYTAFILLFNMGNPAAPSQAAAYLCGMLWSYFFNSRWTFSDKYRSRASFARFVILQIGLMLLSSLAIGALVDRFLLSPAYSWLLIMALITIVNYLCNNHWVFAEPASEKQ